MIQTQHITFAYGKKPVLKDITFSEAGPVIIGMWGRNGAGKTTLMKLLAGHERPNRGRIEIKGLSPYNNERAVKHVCYIQERQPFGINWTMADTLRFGSYFNVNWNQKLADHLLDVFGLESAQNVQKLSGGMRSAIQFIIGLASCADVTIMDEPIRSLDAGMRKNIYQAIRESHEEHPRLILLSTHHIEEVHPICETMMVLHEGKLVLYEPTDIIREKGVWVAGPKKSVQKMIAGQKILEQNEAGPMVKVMLDVPFSDEWAKRGRDYSLSTEKAKLQDYLLNITGEVEVSV